MAAHANQPSLNEEAGEPLAGKHGFDDFLLPGFMRFISHMVPLMKDNTFIMPMIKLLQTGGGAIAAELIPGLANWSLGEYAKNSEMARFAKDSFVHFLNTIVELSQAHGGVEKIPVHEAAKAADKAVGHAENQTCKVWAGMFHDPLCHVLAQHETFRSQHQPRGNRKDRDQQPQQPLPPQSNLQELSLKQCLAQGLKACPHCVGIVQAKLHVPEKKAETAPRSPLELFDTQEEIDAFSAWIKELQPLGHDVRVLKLAMHLDSKKELLNLMRFPSELREEMLTLAENSNHKFKFAQFVEEKEALVRDALASAWQQCKAADAALAPAVRRQKLRAKVRQVQRLQGGRDYWGFLKF